MEHASGVFRSAGTGDMPRKQQHTHAECIQAYYFDWAHHWTTLGLQRKNKSAVAMQLLLIRLTVHRFRFMSLLVFTLPYR
jgi:hypothetical protein